MSHFPHRFSFWWTFVLWLSIVPAVANAQTTSQDRFRDRKQLQASQMREGDSIVLDGRLDEPAWQAAPPVSDFMQREPVNGAPATERTEVRILFDRDRLYIGVECFDSEPDRIIAVQKQRDQNFDGDDRFMWSLDPYFDGRSGYSFTVTPSGAMGDALLVVGQRGTAALNVAWDGIWNARVRRHDQGWTAEIVLPFRTINFDPNAPAWGANFQRTIRRKNEDALWSGWDLNQDLNRMNSAGALVGIAGVSQGFGLDVKPYALGRSRGARPAYLPDGDGPGWTRPLLQRHAATESELHDQHRLRGDGGRRPSGQSDAIPPVFSGTARVLPGRLELLRLRA